MTIYSYVARILLLFGCLRFIAGKDSRLEHATVFLYLQIRSEG